MDFKGVYERLRCVICGVPLEATGRLQRFCSDACRAKESRGLRLWAHAAVNASVDGRPEPPKSWRYERVLAKSVTEPR